jgi:uncharacterized protein (DUF2236 family)
MANAPVLPSPEEARALAPKPGSPVWEYAGDSRLLAAAGYALLLQVTHPTVGAGVSEHSNFKADPWGRLTRTLDYTYSSVYGGAELAAAVGRRVWEMHRDIGGQLPDGRPYHALEPEAYAWVHATLAEAIVTGHRRFGRPMGDAEADRFYRQFRGLGRLVGVRTAELPETWADFRPYFDRMVEERLARTNAALDVLAALREPARPPIPYLLDGAWRLIRLPGAQLVSLATVGLLPPALRERLGCRWTAANDLELRLLAAASRSAGPLLPGWLRNTGPGYVRRRGPALAAAEI